MRHTPLSATDRHRFETRGYLIVRGALTPDEVATLEAAGDRLLASPERRGRQSHPGYDSIRNPVERDPAFLPALTNERVLPLVVQLMSPNLQLHTSHLIHKAGDPGSDPTRLDPGWHRDINTCPDDLGHHAIPRLEIKVAYQLSDATRPESGQTRLVPGSHLLRTDLPRGDDGQPVGVVEPLLAPGDALLFENRTFHAGGPNRRPWTRKTLMYGYSYWWMKPDCVREHPPAIVGRCGPIARQLLGLTGATARADGSFVPGGTERPLVEWARTHGIRPGWEVAPAPAAV